MVGQVLTPATDDQVALMGVIEAVRSNTDAMNRMAQQSEKRDEKQDQIIEALGRIDTRLAVLEQNPLHQQVERNRTDIEKLDSRVSRLEADKQERVGAGKAVKAFKDYAPIVFSVLAVLFVTLVATGRIVL